MPSEEDLRDIENKHKNDNDKLSKSGEDKLKELKAALDAHIKEVKEGELEKNQEKNTTFDKDKFVEQMRKNQNQNGPPFSTLQSTEAQSTENKLNKRITELEKRIQKLESFIFQQFTAGSSQS